MASVKTKFSVGLFLIVGVSVAVIAIIWLGVSGYLEKGRYFIAYFDESVQGIKKDSPVKYRGVYIGRVHRVQVAPDGNLIEVVLKVETEMDLEETYKTSVAQLKTVGITGLMFIELEPRRPGTPVFLPKISFKPEFPVIATRPSELSQLFQKFDDALKMIGELDLKLLSQNAIAMFSTINEAMSSANVARLSSDIQKLIRKTEKMMNSKKWESMLSSVKSSADRFETVSDNADIVLNDLKKAILQIDGIIKNNREPFETALDDVSRAAKKMNTALEKGAGAMDTFDDSVFSTAKQLQITLRGVDKTIEKMNRLIETISDQPSLLLFSKPAKLPVTE